MIKKAILYSLCCLTLLIAAISLAGCRSKVIDTASSESDTTDKSPLASIAGTWREDSENGIKVLIVSQDGNYLVLNEVGATLKGSVKREQADGGKQSRYLFYDETSDLWAESLPVSSTGDKPEEITLTSDGKKMKFAGIDENQKTPAGDYLGTWQSGRCSITISKKGDSYPVDIIWGGSASESLEWNYLCRYDEETATLICDGGAKKADVVYDENGKRTEKVLYSDGSGSFKARGDVLIWTDNQEDTGKDLIFVHLPVEN